MIVITRKILRRGKYGGVGKIGVALNKNISSVVADDRARMIRGFKSKKKIKNFNKTIPTNLTKNAMARFFSNDYNYVIECPEEESRKNEQDLFIPKYDIEFDKEGFAFLLKPKQLKIIRLTQLLILAGSSFLIYKSLTKLWKVGDRSWFGFIFYSAMGIAGMKLGNRWRYFHKKFVERMWIKNDGRTIRIQSGIRINNTFEADIKDVKRGDLESVVNNFGGMIGYPLIFGEQEKLLMRENNVEHPGILAAILNNQYIGFEEYIEVDAE